MMYFGIDNLLQSEIPWKTQRLGLVTNQAATTRDLTASRKALLDAGFNIVTLFSPEHGLDALGADGKPMPDGTDALTGLPIISLYGEKLQPTAEDLAGVDALVFDIPDIGARFYTYLWTLTYIMEAAAAHHKPLYILDRPNPVSGLLSLAEGPLLEANTASFIGRWPIPVRHSCTYGELAGYFRDTRNMRLSLTVIPCTGWTREMVQPDWGIPFVPTSPAIQQFESMLLYPGLCLLEATNLSEGRGTTYSFQSVAAPWLSHEALARILEQMFGDELICTPAMLTPDHGKYSGQACKAVCFQVREPHRFQSVLFGLLLIRLIRDMHPAMFAWAPYPTQVNPTGKEHLDKLLGMQGSEALFDQPFQSFMATLVRMTGAGNWADAMSSHLLY